jgi:hypothetical protein
MQHMGKSNNDEKYGVVNEIISSGKSNKSQILKRLINKFANV